MKFLLGFIISFLSLQTIVGQQNYLPLHSYYRDQILVTNRAETYAGDCMFPITEEEYNVYKYFKDSTVYYYNLPEVIFKKHIIEVQDSDTYVKISPVFDFSFGKDLVNQFNRNLFNNTRGFLAEVNLGKNIALFTTFYENQSRFSTYEMDFYKTRGEFYTYNSGYTQTNAVVPNGGRTKVFKDNNFDYAYAIGYLNWKINNHFRLTLGNNQNFIGAGYRSLLISDNSYSAPNIKLEVKVNQKLKIHIWKTKDLNLVRKKKTTTVEAYYQPKINNCFYASYQLTKNLSIGFFESNIWLKGDSIRSIGLPLTSYNPLPIIDHWLDKSKRYMLDGININYVINQKNRIYAQVVFGNFNIKQGGFQLGWRGVKKVKNSNLLFQTEYNFVSKNTYQATSEAINYSHYNLPLAHPAGNSFHELVLRSSSEFKRFYFDLKIVNYLFKERENNYLLAIRLNTKVQSFFQVNPQVEFGYRFNKKLNWKAFLLTNYRSTTLTNSTPNMIFVIGMKTDLINHYNDF